MPELFNMPDPDEGVGAYIDEIYRSLKYWIENPEYPLQDYELMNMIKDMADEYFERNYDDRI